MIETLNAYKDVITNTLDLLSFILAAPQLLDLLSARTLSAWFVVIPSGILPVVLLFTTSRPYSDVPDYKYGAFFILVNGSAIALYFWLLYVSAWRYDEVAALVKRYAFYVAAFIFFLSRAFALALALYDVAQVQR